MTFSQNYTVVGEHSVLRLAKRPGKVNGISCPYDCTYVFPIGATGHVTSISNFACASILAFLSWTGTT